MIIFVVGRTDLIYKSEPMLGTKLTKFISRHIFIHVVH